MKMFMIIINLIFGRIISLCAKGLNMALLEIRDRRIETYLTNFARSYKDPTYTADFVAPPFKVNKSSDKYLVYDKDVFRLYDNKIKGREKAREITLNADESNYSCEEYALDTFILDRDVRNMSGVGTIRLKEDNIKNVQRAQKLAREKRVYDIAGSATYVTSNTNVGNDWSTAASGTPVNDILTAMKEIEKNSGVTPNRCVVDFESAMHAIQTDEWRDYFKYTVTGPQGVSQMLDSLRNLGLEPRLIGARGLSSNEGGASDPAWERILENKMLLFYAEPNPTPNTMNFMYSPFTEMDLVESYRKPGERGEHYEIYEEIDELLVAAVCAHLLYNLHA